MDHFAALTSSPWTLIPTTLVILLAFSITMGLFSGNKMPVAGKTVLITGGSEGMGLSVAQQLAAKGANIILVSRSTAKLEEALKTVRVRTCASLSHSLRGPATMRTQKSKNNIRLTLL
ncbi:3-dehydrosphinganine reductase [Metarhizium acridum]|nr:3-dehydrosphinganine reductase [Metarhizium acridum]